MGHWTTLDTARGQVAAWHAAPTSRPLGGLVVIQEIFGANAHVRAVADGFAAAGYEVLAPAFFDLVEKNAELDYDPAGRDKGLALVEALGVEAALEVVAAAAAALAPAGKVGTVGYCWGGTIALLAALRLGLPSVSYYGARNLRYLDEKPQAAVMFHFGSLDGRIPGEAIQQHRERLPQMPVFVYPAGHAFNRDGDPHYHEASARLARERTLAFFSENLR
ncbi:dienelactone hydrolase family protein [Flavobacterium sp. MXW15]|uniref:Dienelactone hydrolase family protein n=1 Tax=Xanthomonas chitinilytica TaxID=2989819 RepID=A0ABT3JR46_9XANT|nr:dienelactone hydrolase family protein [Xanthomonas sp. H13-6]MCW4453250.1 dienelactone hydrolase family protein [Flavobacterium sp. MXW15]MCW4470964.1 dienelactone hydrolase family protein [Xanthomonas sp. H13-6]